MAKTEPKQCTPKSRSADEMRFALVHLIAGNQDTGLPPHYDRPDEILKDAIDELLELRQLRADVLAFNQQVQSKLTRK